MRYEKLDIWRWVAIILMVLFHLNYSLLNIFNISTINFSEDLWFVLWKIAASLFIFIWGISFLLAEKKYWKKIIKKYFKVSLLLWIIALWISFWTLIFFEEQHIRFGILHFFALSFLLMLLFRKFKYYNLFIWIIILVYGIYFIPIIQNENFFFLWFTYPWFKSADFFPILPYFWIMLLWYSFALYLNDSDKIDILKLKTNKNIFYSVLEYLWKKSLIIYLLHQPIIILLIYIYIRNTN